VRRVLVVGGGIAGTAAALTAARAQAEVWVVAAGPGATRFAGGALDLAPWERGAPHESLRADAAHVLEALAVYSLSASGALVATNHGLLRPAVAIDAALLDLGPLRGGEVWVPSAGRPSWDAGALARAWSASSEAVARGLRFVPITLPIVRHVEEHGLSDADMAALHDGAPRLDWLGQRLASVPGTHRPLAIVLPPCLGVDQPRAAALSAQVGVRCGEAVSGLAGPSGMRFERARDRALDAKGIHRIAARVMAVTFESGWHARVDGGDLPTDYDAVVLATGGLVGGGLEYRPSASMLATELPSSAGPFLRATLEGPLVIGAHSEPLETPSSLFGAAPETHAWPFVSDGALERGGVLADADGHVDGGPPGLYAAGDLVADRPRTWLDALSLGARAGARAGNAAD
jgi:glycerol-3-phosphate dehydrogenase subunit B